MATKTRTQPMADRLTAVELAEAKGSALFVPGEPYQFILSYGWVLVGFYVCHDTPLSIRLAHANFIRKANKDWAAFAREGDGPNTEWRYLGNWMVTTPQIVHAGRYLGEVHRGNVQLG